MAERLRERQHVTGYQQRRHEADYVLAACYRIARERARMARTRREGDTSDGAQDGGSDDVREACVVADGEANGARE